MRDLKLICRELLIGLKEFGEYPSAIINFLLLTIVYFIGVGLSFGIAKLMKKKLLELDNKSNKSYWRELNLSRRQLKDYLSQF